MTVNTVHRVTRPSMFLTYIGILHNNTERQVLRNDPGSIDDLQHELRCTCPHINFNTWSGDDQKTYLFF